MNKSRRKQPRISMLEISMLILAAIIVMVAGVTHACLKNSYVEVMRAVDKTQQNTEEHKDAVNSLQVKIDKKLNIYQLREELELAGSELVTLPTTSIERISVYAPASMAGGSSGSTTIASINP